MKKIIKGLKIKGDVALPSFLEIMEDKTERLHNNVKCDQLYHIDLKNAMDKLKVHLACICEQIEGQQIESLENIPEGLLEKYEVIGFTIDSGDMGEGVIIIGNRLLTSLKALPLSTPLTAYEDDYRFSDDLAIDVAACIYEAEQYLWNDKYSVKQTEIPFDQKPIDPDGPEVDQKASEMAGAILGEIVNGKKKGRKSKVIQMTSGEPEMAEAAETY
jgi:hypothetical protein